MTRISREAIERVAAIYAWIDEHPDLQWPVDCTCRACGKCCDFAAFDHRLFVTSPELSYFAARAAGPVKPALSGQCPYNIDGMCSVYEHRFAGCRIFNCRASADAQAGVSEQALADLKAICEETGIDYRYVDLIRGLNELARQTDQQAEESCPGGR